MRKHNSPLDYGGFLLILYTLIYVSNSGKQPEWSGLYAGAIGLLIIGIIVEIYRKVKTKNE
jgi:hypothetical protein